MASGSDNHAMTAVTARVRTLLRHPLVRRGLRLALVATVAGGLVVAGSITWVRIQAHGHIYRAADVPKAPVGIVFGALVDQSGMPSSFLVARLTLAERLYDTGKVRALLVSGDNSRSDYDEPDVMRDWLIAHGVPPVKVVADYAGFDTYDTCVRARRIFGVTRAILVTQDFHVPRAIAVCRQEGVVADGVGDTSVDWYAAWWKGMARDQVADVKAAWDTATGRRPVFLGKHEDGIERALATSP
jgi:vancomycin permeability regulator SanA